MNRSPWFLPSLLFAVGCAGAPNSFEARNAPGGPTPTPSPASAAAPEAAVALPPPAPNGEAATPARLVPPTPGGNPFAGAMSYVEPGYVAKVEGSVKADGENAAILRKAEAFPTAVWLSAMKDVDIVPKTLDRSLSQEARAAKPVVTVFALYDLPDRDCAVAASSGELKSADGGERRYRTDYVDKIATAFRARGKLRIVVVLEPDSLANAATNLAIARCAAGGPVYERAVARAIQALATPNVSIYLDAAHAGRLGWADDRARFAKIVADVLSAAGGSDKIRGFATNVSNYDALENDDLADGFGERPRANPAPLVDAYLWVKPPGESDGGSDATRPGYDAKCGGPDAADSAPNAPPARAWFHDYFVTLVKNAAPPL